ncbi:MAG TPA: hypothetical protein VHL11_17530, partial [Phototrophicaceae bacterium]|nr:hypothetical protein [Phototrophicaceae bacterium]
MTEKQANRQKINEKRDLSQDELAEREKMDQSRQTVTEKGKPGEPLSDRAHEIRRKPGQTSPDGNDGDDR